MPRPKITLYIDTVSPFAYEAYFLLRNDAVFSQCDIQYMPIFLGGVMKACGNTPPIHIKNKDKWIGIERVRWAKLFGIPMAEDMPDNFPPLTLSIMRALCALTVVDPDQKTLAKALDAIFDAYWVQHRMPHEPEVLREILLAVLGHDVTNKGITIPATSSKDKWTKTDFLIVLSISGKEGKELLAKNTDRALADGAFGLPWYVCTNSEGKTETFWGVDHIGQVAVYLGLEKPKANGWKAML